MFAVRSRTDARGPLPIAARETKNTKAQSTRPAANGLTNFVTSHGPGACRTRTTVCVIVATALAAAIFATVPAHGEMRMKLHMGLGGLGGDVECIALNIYHEARGEPDLGTGRRPSSIAVRSSLAIVSPSRSARNVLLR